MNRKLRFAIGGLRHGHIFDLIDRLKDHPRVELVAVAEEDATAREAAASKLDGLEIGDSYDALLANAEIDALGIGDYYGIRGSRIAAALESGKHVLTDKPVCTSIEELDRIDALAGSAAARLGCQLDLRSNGALLALRKIIRSGDIGEVVTVSGEGQHPLMSGSRPGWYFEPGKHGGTINDIGIHFFDLIPWLTDRTITGIAAAREWNKKAADFPHFMDCAQCMLVLDNGGGAVADFSYLSPDGAGYGLPQYWRIVVHGTRGVAETHLAAESVFVANDGDSEPRMVSAAEKDPGRYLEDFLDEIEGRPAAEGLTTERVLAASRIALKVQAATGSPAASPL